MAHRYGLKIGEFIKSQSFRFMNIRLFHSTNQLMIPFSLCSPCDIYGMTKDDKNIIRKNRFNKRVIFANNVKRLFDDKIFELELRIEDLTTETTLIGKPFTTSKENISLNIQLKNLKFLRKDITSFRNAKIANNVFNKLYGYSIKYDDNDYSLHD